MPYYLKLDLDLERCPHCCVAKPKVSQTSSFETESEDKQTLRFWGIYICHHCGGVITASSNAENGHIHEMFPNDIAFEDYIPPEAKAFLKQAVDSLHAPCGAILLAARAIDIMIADKGLKRGKLYTRLKSAAENNFISEEMASWGQEVQLDPIFRLDAKSDSKLPDEKDARNTVNFALALAECLFLQPIEMQF